MSKRKVVTVRRKVVDSQVRKVHAEVMEEPDSVVRLELQVGLIVNALDKISEQFSEKIEELGFDEEDFRSVDVFPDLFLDYEWPGLDSAAGNNLDERVDSYANIRRQADRYVMSRRDSGWSDAQSGGQYERLYTALAALDWNPVIVSNSDKRALEKWVDGIRKLKWDKNEVLHEACREDREYEYGLGDEGVKSLLGLLDNSYSELFACVANSEQDAANLFEIAQLSKQYTDCRGAARSEECRAQFSELVVKLGYNK